MRIIFVNTLFTPYQVGGAEKSVRALAESLSSKGHQVAVITLGKEPETIVSNNVQVFRLKLQNIYWPFDSNPNPIQKLYWHWKDTYNKAYDKEILKILKDFQPDVVHTHNLGGFSVRIWELASQFKIPIFHTLRDYYLMSTSTTNLEGEKQLDKLFSRKRKKLSQLVNSVSGISEFILETHLKSGYFRNASKNIIYNGFEFPHSTKSKPIKKELIFGFMGQVKNHKGIYLLLDSFSKLDSGNIKLLIAGDASEELKNQYKDNPKIEFRGFVNSGEFMKQIDILVVPSLWHEPFGRVVMEAIAHKTCVIASRVGGIPELLENNKEFLFDPNEDSLWKLMDQIITRPEILENFSFEEGFLKEFEIETMVKKYESVYKSLILPPNEN